MFAQEFDLREGATVVGRSASCTITIDDPSISREHAEIVVDDRGARIRDLNSRNGVRVNGARITTETALGDGDKIALGQQDLVVLCTRADRSQLATTLDTDRPTPVQPADRTSWWLSLHAELVEKAVSNGRFAEAEQALQRVDEAFAAAILTNDPYEVSAIEPVLAAAIRLALAQGRARWLAWTLQTMRAFRVAPSNALVAQLEAATPQLLDDARVALASYVAEMRASTPSLEGLAAIASDLASTRRLLATEIAVEVPRAS